MLPVLIKSIIPKNALAAHGAYTRLWERMNSGTAETLILSQFLNENQVLVSGQSFTVDSLKLASLKSKAKVKGKTIYRRINLALADAKKLMVELEKLLGPDGIAVDSAQVKTINSAV